MRFGIVGAEKQFVSGGKYLVIVDVNVNPKIFIERISSLYVNRQWASQGEIDRPKRTIIFVTIGCTWGGVGKSCTKFYL